VTPNLSSLSQHGGRRHGWFRSQRARIPSRAVCCNVVPVLSGDCAGSLRLEDGKTYF
jgi:hypothetical protein